MLLMLLLCGFSVSLFSQVNSSQVDSSQVDTSLVDSSQVNISPDSPAQVESSQVQQLKAEEQDTLFVKYKTVLERYEAAYVATTQERLQMKKRRKALIRFRESVIDTLPVSNRLKRRLLKELYNTPFTEEWSRVLADLEFEDPLEAWEY